MEILEIILKDILYISLLIHLGLGSVCFGGCGEGKM